MLSFFRPPAFRDSQLGEFERSRGHWRGRLEVGGSVIPLVLVGGRSEPDAQALCLARTVSPCFSTWRPTIAEALFEHYQPYAEAVSTGEAPASRTPLPRIGTPADVWPHTTVVFALVAPLDRVLTVEFGFTTVWDEEHTLGARFQHGELLELNGSVLPP